MFEKGTRWLSNGEIDERRDLRNTLTIGVFALFGFGGMILVSGPIVMWLPIPTTELTLVAVTFGVITIGSMVALDRNWPVRPITWAVLVAYTIIVSLVVYFTGAPLTPIFALYMLVVTAAAFLLGQRGAMIIAVLNAACYAAVLILEYYEILRIIPLWRLSFTLFTREHLLVINWLTVSISILLTAQLTGILAERLKKSNASLRESERLRESLTGMIVHDLRNPLTALLGGMDILRLTMGTHMNADQKSLLENARHSGQTLLDMIGELLDLSKMEAGKLILNVQPVDLTELINKNLDMVRTLSEEGKIDIHTVLFDNVKSVPCDRQLISRVVNNLLSNALKFTPPNGRISIMACLRGNAALVSVADTGPGIALQHQQHIFEKFGQVKEPGQERRGTGLGLTFCKMAVEAHGGKIWVESQVGEGSTFYFTLPMAGSQVRDNK